MAQIAQFTPSDIVVVTGANGHVGQHIVEQLLNHPGQPKVLATVRSESSASPLRTHYSGTSNRLALVFIPDIKASGAFDEVLSNSDITYIAHVASPVVFKVEDVARDLLEPAVRGTTSLLNSALKAPKLKGVVITSSFAAVHDAAQGYHPGYTYTDQDWNPITWEEATDPNLDLNKWPEIYRGFIHYCASKKLAEKAIWDFVGVNKPNWTVSTILPTWIGGPYVLPPKIPDGLSVSTVLPWNVMKNQDQVPKQVDYPYWIDVRDVARAHIQALLCPAANGKRFILATDAMDYSKLADIIRQVYPEQPVIEAQDTEHYSIDSETPRKILKMNKYINKEQMTHDAVRQLLQVSGKE